MLPPGWYQLCQATNARVHCMEDLTEKFVTECLLKVQNLFLDQYGIK